jgi:hypothetical protein
VNKRRWILRVGAMAATLTMLAMGVAPALADAASVNTNGITTTLAPPPSTTQVVQFLKSLAPLASQFQQAVQGMQGTNPINVVQNGPSLLTGPLLSEAQSNVGQLQQELAPITTLLQSLKSSGSTSLDLIKSLDGSVGVVLPGVGDVWASYNPSNGETDVCLMVPNGKFMALAGISNGNPLCGGTSSQLANPSHKLVAFADFTTDGSSYIDMQLPFDGSLPHISAQSYVPVGGHYLQVTLQTLTNNQVNLQFALALVGQVEADTVTGSVTGAVTLSIVVDPNQVADVASGAENALSAALQTQGTSALTLTPQQAGAVMSAVVQYLKNYAPAHPGALGQASLGVDVTGQLGVGIAKDMSIPAVGATAGVSVSAPIDNVVNATGSALAAFISTGQTLANGAQGLVTDAVTGTTPSSTLGSSLSSTWSQFGQQFVGDVVQEADQANLNLNLSVDALGQGPTSAVGGNQATTSLNLLHATASLPMTSVVAVAGQSSFWTDWVNGTAALFSEPLHELDSNLPAPNLAPLTQLGQDFNTLLSQGQFSLAVAVPPTPLAEVTAQFNNGAALAESAAVAGAALQAVFSDMVASAEQGSLQPLNTSGVTALFNNGGALNNLLTNTEFGIRAGLGASASIGAAASVQVGAGAAVYAQTTPELLVFLASDGSDTNAQSPGQGLVGMDVTAGVGGSYGIGSAVQLQGSIGGSLSTTLWSVSLNEFDGQAPPSYQNFLDVYGFPVMDFQGTFVNGNPVGTGQLILPNVFATVPVNLGVNSNGTTQDTWSGGIRVNGYQFSVGSGTLDAAGLHWVGNLGVAGQSVGFNMTLTSSGSLSGSFSGSLNIDGWSLTNVNLAFNGQSISGTADMSLGPVSGTSLQLREQGQVLEGQGTLSIGGATVSNVQFQLDGQGNFYGYGEVQAGPANLWSVISISSNPLTISIRGSGSFDLSAGFSLSQDGFGISGSVSLSGDLMWSGASSGSGMQWSIGTQNDRACVSGSVTAVGITAISISPCITAAGGTASLNPSNGTFSIPLTFTIPINLLVKTINLTFTVNPTFSLPSGTNGFNNLPSNIDGVGYTPLSVPPTTQAPVTTASTSPQANSNGWYNGPVTVTLTATDSSSPVATTEYSLDGGPWTVYTGPFTISSEGRHTLLFFSTDQAGDAGNIQSLTVPIDLTPPVTLASVSGQYGTNGWYMAGRPVVLTLMPYDPPLQDGTAGSGVTATYYSVNGGAAELYTGPVTFTDGIYTVSFWSVDAAGNVARADTIGFKVDQTPPVTTLTLPPADSYGWYNQPVTAQIAATDNLSGVAFTRYSLNGTLTTVDNTSAAIGQTFTVPITTNGVNILQYASVDRAGNQETPHSATIRIDALPPEANIFFAVPPATNPNVAVEGTDGISGVAGETGPVCGPVTIPATTGHGTATGAHAEQCVWTITNKALNTLTVTVDVKQTNHQIQARVVQLTYTTHKGTQVLTPEDNRLKVEWTTAPNGSLAQVEQQVILGGLGSQQIVEAHYDAGTGTTTIVENGHIVTMPGLSLLTISTNEGQLSLNF